MALGFGTALLLVGAILVVAALLSGLMRGTVLSISILAVSLGLILGGTGVIDVSPSSPAVAHLIELALALTLFSDGLLVERELLARHWTPAARALAIAMPLTIVFLALAAKLLFSDLGWPEAFLLAAVLGPTDPVITSTIVSSERVPATVRHTLNLESGLNDGLALPLVLFFLILASPGGNAGVEAAKLLGDAAFGAVIGVVVGVVGGRLQRHGVAGGITQRYQGIYAVGLALLAFGIADVTFGNSLIAAFVTGIAIGVSEHEVPEAFVTFSENLSAIFQVLTFVVFGALIYETVYHEAILELVAFVAFALLIARPAGVLAALAGTRIPRPHRTFMAWFGAKGVASILFALLVLDSSVTSGALIFEVAAYTVLASIVAHGLTDTLGARWIHRRMEAG
jgi:sodium/hydrogen antiporter